MEITAYVSNKVLELLPGIDKQTLEYSRFLIHLKYFSIRYLADKQYNEDEVNISLKSDKTLVLNQVIEEVSQVLKDKYGQHLNKYEKSYLLLHLNRIIK
ncbi:PRD domain-containing protein [Streptococcus gallolyticus subsp. gallolyticus]|uniref:PRD domain-containing protein n=1 Tax=Streptococcus gallolyticus TaxID=315405 RepID=UPI002284FD7C|nr:PRD domain-containing protein [Streptococcus gallolyticus]MCY7178937.1 PRD domain-containing protein [Streptococcus gallolyticus subsp. gallolyticus]